MKLKKELNKLRDLILEIISRLNLTFNKTPNFENLAEFLYKHSLLNNKYYNKILSLDSINENELERSESLKLDLNDIQLYLEMKFYHYI